MPVGAKKRAVEPLPLVLPLVPAIPAIVVTVWVAGTIMRIVWLSVFATYRFPRVSMVIAAGLSKVAAVPMPSAPPDCSGFPAMVVTTPAGVTLRMVLFSVSATYTLPEASTVTSEGKSNRAELVPSEFPAFPASPAKVVTAPVDRTIFRMVWLLVSAM